MREEMDSEPIINMREAMDKDQGTSKLMGHQNNRRNFTNMMKR